MARGSDLAPMTAVVRLIYVSLLNKHFLRARLLDQDWFLFSVAGSEHAGMPSCISPERWSLKEEQNADRWDRGTFLHACGKSQAEVEGRCGGVEVRVQGSPWSVLACSAEPVQETSAHASSSHWRLIIIRMFAAGKPRGGRQKRRKSSCQRWEFYWRVGVKTELCITNFKCITILQTKSFLFVI